MRATRTNRIRGQEGITLIEALVSMIILAVISTMIVMGWANLQRASATALRENNARASLRDAMSRISTEVRAAQPTALPTVVASATPVELLQEAGPMEVQFYSAFNTVDADIDGTGLATMRLTSIWLDPDEHPPSWNQQCGTLFWQRDSNNNGTIDSGDRITVLARNVANDIVDDAAHGTDYTAVFRYGYRATKTDPVDWTDNLDGALDPATVVAVSVRLIIDKNMGATHNYADLRTTVRLRNVIDE